MADNDEKTGQKTKRNYDKRNVIVGVICLLLIAAGIGYIWHKNAKPPQPADDVTSAVAVVDIDRLIAVACGSYFSSCLLISISKATFILGAGMSR